MGGGYDLTMDRMSKFWVPSESFWAVVMPSQPASPAAPEWSTIPPRHVVRKILLRICVDHEIWWEFWCKGGTTSVHVRRSCHWDHPRQYIHWSYIIFSWKLTIWMAVISCLRLKSILWYWAWKVTEIAFILFTRLTTIMWCWAWKLTRICFYNMPKVEHYCVMLGMNI